MQVAEHPSPFILFPSSHCSPNPAWRIPSPQNSMIQAALHPSPEILFPSSHCSPPSTIPLPHSGTGSNRQVAEHPSPEILFPSSHCSLHPIIPLPQIVGGGCMFLIGTS